MNRSAVEEIEFDHSMISGGISKINTADNLIGIFPSRAMRERGRYQIQLMKTRSSSGVGAKVDLEFDVDTLRITDLDEDEESNTSYNRSTSSVLDNLKRNNSAPKDPDNPSEGETVGKVRAEASTTQLKNFLNTLGGE